MSFKDTLNGMEARPIALIAVFAFAAVAMALGAATGGYVGFYNTTILMVAIVGSPIGYYFGSRNTEKQAQAGVDVTAKIMKSIVGVIKEAFRDTPPTHPSPSTTASSGGENG